MNRPSLTKQQNNVWKALNAMLESNELSPTHQELADYCGCARTTITIHLTSLEKKGYIKRSRNWRDMQVITDDNKQQTLPVELSELIDAKIADALKK
tara:strand:+ start:2796 stop:3086 length:291 start_codon:yes stop_codon:yes gene_type:complete